MSGTYDTNKSYVTVDSIGYDATNKKLCLKVDGADTVVPFNSSEYAEYEEGTFSVSVSGAWAWAYYTVNFKKAFSKTPQLFFIPTVSQCAILKPNAISSTGFSGYATADRTMTGSYKYMAFIKNA